MNNSTKMILVGLGVCVVLGIILQSVIAGVMQQSMSGQELLTPDQAAKKVQKDALKDMKERAKNH